VVQDGREVGSHLRALEHLTRRDIAFALGGAGGLVVLGAAAASIVPASAIGVVAGVLFLGVAILLERHRAALGERLTELEGALSQVEPLIALSTRMNARRALPPMTEYAIAPDFALMLYELVEERAPRVIVETGSGVSTLICAYALEKVGGEGHVTALDHDAKFAEKTRAVLASHGLSHRATVIHAPLEKTGAGGEQVLWYRKEALGSVEAIDLVVDDGPPKYVGPMARYASLHVLGPKMGPSGLFVLDCVGKEEKEIVRRWCAELPFDAEWLATRKGNVIFRRKKAG
jgi:predicted O-methyltransferase YrrM